MQDVKPAIKHSINIKEIHMGEDKQIIYLWNNDVIISEDGWGARYNNNYELYHQLCEYAITDVDYLKKGEEKIEEFKKEANNYLKYVFNEIEDDGYTIQKIEKYKFNEFKNSFEVLKIIKF